MPSRFVPVLARPSSSAIVIPASGRWRRQLAYISSDVSHGAPGDALGARPQSCVWRGVWGRTRGEGAGGARGRGRGAGGGAGGGGGGGFPRLFRPPRRDAPP